MLTSTSAFNGTWFLCQLIVKSSHTYIHVPAAVYWAQLIIMIIVIIIVHDNVVCEVADNIFMIHGCAIATRT